MVSNPAEQSRVRREPLPCATGRCSAILVPHNDEVTCLLHEHTSELQEVIPCHSNGFGRCNCMLYRVCIASSASSVLFDSLHVFEPRDTTDRGVQKRDDLIVRQMGEPDAFDEISIPAPLAARDDLSRFPAYAFGIGDDAQSISDLPTAST
jgi:hypothetical protein